MTNHCLFCGDEVDFKRARAAIDGERGVIDCDGCENRYQLRVTMRNGPRSEGDDA